MSDFAQVSPRVTTLHILNNATDHIREKLNSASSSLSPVLIIPCLATEFNRPDSRRVFQNILRGLVTIPYPKHIIFGLDSGAEEDVLLLQRLIRGVGMDNGIIQWNDNPGLEYVYQELGSCGVPPGLGGKGHNLFMCFGLAAALKAGAVGVMDADIRSFTPSMVDRLMFPVAALDYDISKGYYSRVTDNRMYGRVKRLLLDPLLLALKDILSRDASPALGQLADFLLSIRYQLSGEIAIKSAIAVRMRFPVNWGVEIYSLLEAHRKASSICQVHLTLSPYDHKHHDPLLAAGEGESLGGMAFDIVETLLGYLIEHMGLTISPDFFEELAASYSVAAKCLIEKYADEAYFNGFEFDSTAEYGMVNALFQQALISAGEKLMSELRLKSDSHGPDSYSRGLLDGDLPPLGRTPQAGEPPRQKTGFKLLLSPSWLEVADRTPGVLEQLLQKAYMA